MAEDRSMFNDLPLSRNESDFLNTSISEVLMLEMEIKARQSRIKEIYKSLERSFSIRALRDIVRERLMDPERFATLHRTKKFYRQILGFHTQEDFFEQEYKNVN